jgi:hypothetical protein
MQSSQPGLTNRRILSAIIVLHAFLLTHEVEKITGTHTRTPTCLPATQEFGEVIVVCDPSYREVFENLKLTSDLPIKFALPGMS